MQELLEKNFEILQGLTPDQVEQLIGMAEIIDLNQGDMFIREGEEDHAVYLVLEGECKVIKAAQGAENAHVIAQLVPGAVLGEMALIENKPRSASVVATTPMQVAKIDADILKQDNHIEIYSTLIANVAHSLSNRLRYNNEVTVKTMEEQLEQSRKRVALGIFMVRILFITSFYVLSINGIKYLQTIFQVPTVMSVVVIVAFTLVLLTVMRDSGYPYERYGVTLKNWRANVVDAIVLSLPIMFLVTFGKWLLIRLDPAFASYKVFGFDAGLPPDEFTWVSFILIAAVYSMFVPLQEFAARSGIQAVMQMFLHNAGTRTREVWVPIILSNLMFSTTHSHLTMSYIIGAFVTGIFWGWMFARQGSLVGPIVSHILIGVYCLFFVGIPY